MFNTPNGIAMIDVAKIGTPDAKADIVAPRARGGYFARRTREIYYTGRAAATVAGGQRRHAGERARCRTRAD